MDRWINSLELLELSSISKVSSVQVFSCSNTGSIRDGPLEKQFGTDKAMQFKKGVNKFSLPVFDKSL